MKKDGRIVNIHANITVQYAIECNTCKKVSLTNYAPVTTLICDSVESLSNQINKFENNIASNLMPIGWARNHDYTFICPDCIKEKRK